MIASWGIGLLTLRQGDLPRALPLLEQAIGICQEADLPFYFPWMAAALGAAYNLGGRVADAVPLLTQAMEQTMAMETVTYQALCGLPLGDAHMLAGRLEEAHAHAERTLAHAREHQERGNEAYALRLLGEIAMRRDPPESEQAEAHYRQALALADELGMRPLVAHCHRGLGMLYLKLGRRAQARPELSAAIALYRAMDMTFWLPQTEAALAQVEGADDFDELLAKILHCSSRKSGSPIAPSNTALPWMTSTSKMSRPKSFRPNSWPATRREPSWSGREALTRRHYLHPSLLPRKPSLPVSRHPQSSLPRLTPNAASSLCCFVTWYTRPCSPASSTRKSCARS